MLFKLPAEIIFNIAHHLPITTQSALARTSKLARDILRNEVKRDLKSRSVLVWEGREIHNPASYNIFELTECGPYMGEISKFKRLVTACEA